mmetsp:Transcript_23022/g.30055  ORF Transcript_23022/g.30055 Transcript_23022/m.30055 type:complete len:159 (+) Transcript_23022:153-629(+)|eukprot:CAMPEP_0117854458 /NCGR_PEP_ID=MMETSP0950-20121206/28_1 /TAXON_ID=44440 /ORGANISM="Chattonella subsalsa, Strain CCMP2191" /LENGTH=158 /DNA_ID=CAMNT_0005703101 /DNA_START=408 /DNA_END=884 /DNA_ORIENTATION=+
MYVTKEDRIAVYSYLFKEGVCVVKKDNYKPKHGEIDVPNLVVMNLMKSLRSRGYVRVTFSWQYSYCYLTNEGIEYLREYLHLPEEIVPATLKKAASRPARPTYGAGGDRGGSRFDDKGKRMGPSGDFNPEFSRGGQDGYRGGEGGMRGGFGRGGGAQF